jgi:putative addiction module component (TIGR02574 family)
MIVPDNTQATAELKGLLCNQFNPRYPCPMPVTLPLSDLTVSEKLQLMEALWEDLSRNADALESPEWHREVLEDRQRRIASGEAHFSDWEQAKADIRKRVS